MPDQYPPVARPQTVSNPNLKVRLPNDCLLTFCPACRDGSIVRQLSPTGNRGKPHWMYPGGQKTNTSPSFEWFLRCADALWKALDYNEDFPPEALELFALNDRYREKVLAKPVLVEDFADNPSGYRTTLQLRSAYAATGDMDIYYTPGYIAIVMSLHDDDNGYQGNCFSFEINEQILAIQVPWLYRFLQKQKPKISHFEARRRKAKVMKSEKKIQSFEKKASNLFTKFERWKRNTCPHGCTTCKNKQSNVASYGDSSIGNNNNAPDNNNPDNNSKVGSVAVIREKYDLFSCYVRYKKCTKSGAVDEISGRLAADYLLFFASLVLDQAQVLLGPNGPGSLTLAFH
jgi:hypothetical protein